MRNNGIYPSDKMHSETYSKNYDPTRDRKVIKLILHNITYEGHSNLYFYSVDDPYRKHKDQSFPAKATSEGVAAARQEVIYNMKNSQVTPRAEVSRDPDR